jgi:hypothetical protein
MTRTALSLDMALLMFGSHKCSEPRDHIYALLGISISSDFPVKYAKPLVDLYWEVLAHIYKDNDCAQLLRGTSKSLQQQMGLSDDEVWKRWAELVKEDLFADLWGYQFVEAMRMIIGELINVTPQGLSSRLPSGFPTFNVDYADILEHDFKSAGKKSITALYELFKHIDSGHPSTLSSPLGFSIYGQELGDYFVGNIVDATPLPTSEYKTQRQLYADGRTLIPFPLDQSLSVLQYSPSHFIDFGRQSKMKHLLLAMDTKSQHDKLLPLAKDDIVCMFSGYQAALVIRRLPGDKLFCGVAVVEFKASNWAVRTFARISSPSVRLKSKTETIDLRKSRIGTQSAYSVHVFMKPHSIVSIENWNAEVGRPYRGPFLEHCMCKPGEGGCR